MATIQKDRILQFRGQDLRDNDGSKIGSIEEIYLDTQTGEPEWALVHTGLFGSKQTFVPIRDATEADGGLQVPFEKSQVKDAPKLDPDGELSQREEAELYRHYGMAYSDSDSDTGLGEGAGAGTAAAGTTSGDRTSADRERSAGDASATGGRTGDWSEDDASRTTGDANVRGDAGTSESFGGAPPVGDDVSGPETDNAMTRSEEELSVGTREREAGRARLKKYVVTEQVEQTIPVKREEVRLEREPISDANVDAAMDGPELSEEEHEVVLHAEEPVAEKRVVPKERVRLDTDVKEEQRTVSEDVSREEIALDDAGARRNA